MIKKFEEFSDVENKFNEWKRIFTNYTNNMIEELQEDYLDEIGLHIIIDDKYSFAGGKTRWLAAYEKRSRRIMNGEICIAINYKAMYNKMCQLGIDDDLFNIEAQARITIGHEIGHGLIDYFKTFRISKKPTIAKLKSISDNEEEKIVEQFGDCMFPEATYEYDSIILDALKELKK